MEERRLQEYAAIDVSRKDEASRNRDHEAAAASYVAYMPDMLEGVEEADGACADMDATVVCTAEHIEAWGRPCEGCNILDMVLAASYLVAWVSTTSLVASEVAS